MRRRGLSASAAILHILEQTPEPSVVDVAQLLLESGYGDQELFRGLLENGISSSDSLTLLREQGWSLSRLVAVLIERNMLLPEIRDRLDALGVTRHLQLTLLRPHVEHELLMLVLGEEPLKL